MSARPASKGHGHPVLRGIGSAYGIELPGAAPQLRQRRHYGAKPPARAGRPHSSGAVRREARRRRRHSDRWRVPGHGPGYPTSPSARPGPTPQPERRTQPLTPTCLRPRRSRLRPHEDGQRPFRHYALDGALTRAPQQIQAAVDAAGDIDRLVQVDSTVVRAHQHAVAGRNGGGSTDRTTRTTITPSAGPRADRPPESASPTTATPLRDAEVDWALLSRRRVHRPRVVSHGPLLPHIPGAPPSAGISTEGTS